MKILFVAQNAKYVHTNIAVRYLSKFISQKGFCASFSEFTINQPKDLVLRKLYMSDADVYGFSCYIWNIERVLSVAKDLKVVKPNSKIILGGPEVSFENEDFLKEHSYIDAIIKGEGEYGTLELLKSGDIKGIVSSYEKVSLDELPFPYDDKDLKECVKGEKLIYYETSRGCPFSCSYCLSSVTEGVRYLSMERIKIDIERMVKAGVSTIKFVDRTFNADINRAMEIWSFCASIGGETKFHFEIGADLITKEALSLLKTVPKDAFMFEIGVQSTNLKTLKEVSRKTDLEKLKENVKALREENNIHLHLDLIAGLPYENYESFKNSFNEVISLKPHALQLGFLKLLKGSNLRRRAEEFSYAYSVSPPYRVFYGDMMTREEMIKLELIEDVLDRYYNSERFINSLPYIMGAYDTPFDFFERLSEYFNQKGLIGEGVKRITLYGILFDFVKENFEKDLLESFRQKLIKDFNLWHSNGVGTPLWYKNLI